MKARFIRDDGERLSLTMAEGFVDKSTDDWLSDKPLRTSMFTYSGADGGQMVAQNYDPWPIKFTGFLKRGTANEVWTIRQRFMTFFAKQHNFTAVFDRCDGQSMAVLNGWVSTAPQVALSGKLDNIQNYSVVLTFGDPYLYSYSEDDKGNQVYSKTLTVERFSTDVPDGYAYGAGGYIYYGDGYVYIGGVALTPTVNNDSIRDIAPVWRVEGVAINPSITNLTTNKQLKYSGTIGVGQELVVDCYNQTAMIGTADVTRYMNGEWLTLAVGNNRVRYETDNEGAPASTLEWNEVIG